MKINHSKKNLLSLKHPCHKTYLRSLTIRQPAINFFLSSPPLLRAFVIFDPHIQSVIIYDLVSSGNCKPSQERNDLTDTANKMPASDLRSLIQYPATSIILVNFFCFFSLVVMLYMFENFKVTTISFIFRPLFKHSYTLFFMF